MMRRCLWFTIASLIAVGMAGCFGGDDAPDERVEQGRTVAPGQPKVKVAWVRRKGKTHYQRTGAITYCTDTASAARRQAVDRFNASYNPGEPVRVMRVGGDTWSQYDTFVKRLHECDVFDADVIATGALADKRLVYDMSPYVERRRDQFVGNAVRTACYGTKFWGVPHSTNVGLLFFRTDRRAQAPSTWQEAYRSLAFQGGADEGLTVNFLELAVAAGGRVLTRDGTSAVLDREPNLKALTLMVAAVKNSTAIPVNGEVATAKVFRSGETDLMRNWPVVYQRKYWDEPGPALSRRQVRIAPLPLFENAGVAGVLGGANLVISIKSRNPAAALAFVDFLTTLREQRRSLAQFEPPAIGEAYKQAPRSFALELGDYGNEFLRELRRAVNQATPRPVFPAYRRVSAAIATNVRRALDDKASPEEALATAHDKIDEIVRKVPEVAPCTG